MDSVLADEFSETLTLKAEHDEDELPLPDFLERTENGAVAYNTEGWNSLVKLFCTTPDTGSRKIFKLLNENWIEGNKLSTLKVIFLTGHVREGKMDNKNFLIMLRWLYDNHPATLLCNLQCIMDMTYAKNLLELLVLILYPNGFEVQEIAMAFHKGWLNLDGKIMPPTDPYSPDQSRGYKNERKQSRRESKKIAFAEELNVELASIYERGTSEPKWKDEIIKEKWDDFCERQRIDSKAMERHANEQKKISTRAFLKNKRMEGMSSVYDSMEKRIIDIFSFHIVDVWMNYDLYVDGKAASGYFGPGHLCAKWFPNRNGRHDKILGIRSKMVDKLSQEVLKKEPWRISVTKHEVAKFITQLRKDAYVAESFIGSGDWDKIDVDRLPGRCRLLYGPTVFKRHVPDYMKNLAKPEKLDKINVGGVLLHELMCKAVVLHAANFGAEEVAKAAEGAEAARKAAEEAKAKAEAEPARKAAEDVEMESVSEDSESSLGWESSWKCNAMDLSTSLLSWEAALLYSPEERELLGLECEVMWQKKLKQLCNGREFNALCMSDVSGSMQGTPLKVAIALGVAISSMQPPGSAFRNKVLTFEETPQIVELDEPIKLAEAAVKILKAGWGGSTNIEAALELYLELTKEENNSCGVLVIVSDMQFDAARGWNAVPWETTYEKMVRRFGEENVEVPLIIFWCVRDTKTVPVQSAQMRGVVMLAGFSETLLESLFDPDIANRTPESELKKYLCHPAFQTLRLSDVDLE